MAARGRGCLGNGGGVLEGLLSLFSSPLFSPYFSSPFLFSSLPPSLSIPSVTPPRSIAPLSSVPPAALTAGLHSVTESVLEWQYHDATPAVTFPAPSVTSQAQS